MKARALESTPENLPQRLRIFHALAMDRPALAAAAPIIEAAEEIERLRKCLDSRDSFLVNKGLFQEYADQLPR